jgi:hypothetical protein
MTDKDFIFTQTAPVLDAMYRVLNSSNDEVRKTNINLKDPIPEKISRNEAEIEYNRNAAIEMEIKQSKREVKYIYLNMCK